MNTRPASQPDPGASPSRDALLSAMADGDAGALERGCELWRTDAGARATWHAYHLIGDVMRSEDLASSPSRDAAFLVALRGRLADEPVLLAPAPAASPARRRQRWLLPSAAAAGFVAVAGVMVVARMPDSPPGVAVTGALPVAQREGVSTPRPVQVVRIDEGKLIRDPRLDAYLEAHRQAFSGRAAAVPGGVPRYVGASPAASAVPVSR